MLSAVINFIRSYPALPRAWQLVHHGYILPDPLVLGSASLNFLTLTVDRDRTVLRRSKPSSRTTLIGEQPNPWNLFQLQDVMSRHRGAKRLRRYELLGVISLLSLEYLLSVERWSFHSGSPDHYDRLPSLFDGWVSQSSKLLSWNSTVDFWPTWAYLLYTSVTLWEVTAPVKLPTLQCPIKIVSSYKLEEWYFIDA